MTNLGVRSLPSHLRRQSARPVAAVAAVAAVSAFAGLLVASGEYRGAAIAAGALGLLFALSARPHLAVLLCLVLVDSVLVVVGLVAARFGPLGVHWTDMGLAAVVLAAAITARRATSDAPKTTVAALVAVAPFLAVQAAKAMIAVESGVEWTAVGALLRPLAWYAAFPALVVLVQADDGAKRVVRYVHVVAAATCVVVVGAAVSGSVAATLAPVLGSRLVGIPGYAGALMRLYVPGMNLVPLALGLVLGRHIERGHERWSLPEGVLFALYGVGLVFTFGRGMWLWTMLALASAFLLRAHAEVLVRVLAVVLALTVLVVGLNAVIGRTDEMPNGLLDLVGQRAQILLGGDVNAQVRSIENKQVIQDVGPRVLTGVGLDERLGSGSRGGAEGTVVYAVHNGYYHTYGRFGVIGLGALMFFVLSVLLRGARSVEAARGSALPLAFGGFVGFLRGVLSAWTQGDVWSAGGILVLVLSAALIYCVYYATIESRPATKPARLLQGARS